MLLFNTIPSMLPFPGLVFDFSSRCVICEHEKEKITKTYRRLQSMTTLRMPLLLRGQL